MLKSTIALVKISTKNLSTDHLSYLQKLREIGQPEYTFCTKCFGMRTRPRVALTLRLRIDKRVLVR
jgi:hypothetical protein